jgi:hypothetical protein
MPVKVDYDRPMFSPKITILIVLVSLLAIYHRSLSTPISSIFHNPTIKTDSDIAANVLNSTTDGGTKKALGRKKFESAWKDIRSELLVSFERQGMPVDAREWYQRVSGSRVDDIVVDILVLGRTWTTTCPAVN